jgi:hypothetical protein
MSSKEALSEDRRMIDYLDKPPQRYAHVFQKASGSREMVEDADGDWVKYEDMDLYMFEGGQLALTLVAENQRLREALKIVAEGAICPDLFPDEKDEKALQIKTAMTSAIAALEHPRGG